MDRRELIRTIAVLTGASVIGAEFFLSGCQNPRRGDAQLTGKDVALLDEIADTILPATASSPGAKEAGTGAFIALMIQDCLDQTDQDIVAKGLLSLQEAAQAAHGQRFEDCTPEQRHQLLLTIDQEAGEHNDKRKEEMKTLAVTNTSKLTNEKVKPTLQPHYYTFLKSYTLLGFFTSEIGQKKAMRFNPIPGRFDGNLPYKKGDKMFSGA